MREPHRSLRGAVINPFLDLSGVLEVVSRIAFGSLKGSGDMGLSFG